MIYLKDTENQPSFSILAQYNFETIETWFLSHKPTRVGTAETTIVGPPTSDEWPVGRLWRDALLALFRCTVAGTPGTWVQIDPAIVAEFPEDAPDGYEVKRSDENLKAYRYDESTDEWLETSSGVGGISAGNERVKDPVHHVLLDLSLGGTYDVGTKTITGGDVGVLMINSVAVSEGESVLLCADLGVNGIYEVIDPGDGDSPFILTRRDDADTAAKLLGAVVPVVAGDVYVARVMALPFSLGDDLFFDKVATMQSGFIYVPLLGGLKFGESSLGYITLGFNDDGSSHLAVDSRVKAKSFSVEIDEVSAVPDELGNLVIDSEAGIVHVLSADGNFTLHGLQKGLGGKRVTVRNKTAHSMFVAHESADGPIGLRIFTPNGATLTDVKLLSLYYDPAEFDTFGGWIVEHYY